MATTLERKKEDLGSGQVRGDGLWLTVTAALAAVAFFLWRTPYGFDDAYITYRYSRNIALGNGYVYNLGERVQGTSTPLYTLWLSLFGLAGHGRYIPLVSVVTGLLCFCGTAVLLFLLVSRLHSRLAAGIAVALLLTSPPVLRTVTSGMETSAYCFLILLSFFLYSGKRYWGAFLAATLCALTRLDGGLVLVVLLGTYLFEYRRLPWRDLLLPALLLVAWFGFAYLYFGSIWPASFLAKQYHTGHHKVTLWMLHALIGNKIAFLAALGGAIALLKSKPRQAAPLAFWAVGYVLAYSVSELEQYLWYTTPILMMLYLAAGIGLATLAAVFTSAVSQRLTNSLGALAVVAGTVATAITMWPFARDWRAPHVIPVEAARYDAARFAAAHMEAGAVDVSGGIGMIGWFSNDYILDSLGLVSPQTLRKYPGNYYYSSLASTVADNKPEYVFDAMGNAGITDWPPSVTNHYHIVREFPTQVPAIGDGHLYEFAHLIFILWQRDAHDQ